MRLIVYCIALLCIAATAFANHLSLTQLETHEGIGSSNLFAGVTNLVTVNGGNMTFLINDYQLMAFQASSFDVGGPPKLMWKTKLTNSVSPPNTPVPVGCEQGLTSQCVVFLLCHKTLTKFDYTGNIAWQTPVIGSFDSLNMAGSVAYYNGVLITATAAENQDNYRDQKDVVAGYSTATGQELWNVTTPSVSGYSSVTTPVIDERSGSVIVAMSGAVVSLQYQTGSVFWNCSTCTDVRHSPPENNNNAALVPALMSLPGTGDRVVLFSTRKGVLCLDVASGATQWHVGPYNQVASNFVIAYPENGKKAVISFIDATSDTLTTLDGATGAFLWETYVGSAIVAPMLLRVNGSTVLLSQEAGDKLHLRDPLTGKSPFKTGYSFYTLSWDVRSFAVSPLQDVDYTPIFWILQTGGKLFQCQVFPSNE